MTQAVGNGAVLAESDACHFLEGNCYFPPESVRREFLRPSNVQTICR